MEEEIIKQEALDFYQKDIVHSARYEVIDDCKLNEFRALNSPSRG